MITNDQVVTEQQEAIPEEVAQQETAQQEVAQQEVAQQEVATAQEAQEDGDVDANINDFFDNFTANQGQESGEWTYFGFGMDWQNPQVRLAILDTAQGLIFIPMNDIGRIVASPDGDGISMLCNGYRIIIRGENLLPIMEPLQNNYLSFLEVFHAEQYAEPEEGEVIIRKIKVLNH